MSAALLLAALVLGYLVGRLRPLRRTCDWANWQTYGRLVRRGPRWWVVWTVLSAENIAWLIAHPVRGWHAWKHRNDPPPPRGPAMQVARIHRDAS